MTLLDRLFSPQAAVSPYSPLHDHWWKNIGGAATLTGVPVDADSALKASTFFAGVRLLSFTVGRLPIGVFLQGTRTKALNHWSYRLLAQHPNHWQTPFEFKQWAFSSVLRKGAAYAYMLPGPGETTQELIPIDRDRVEKKRLSSNAIVYDIQRDFEDSDTVQNVVPARVPQERMMEWRSPFGDGLEGKSLITYARETLGLAIAQQEHTQRVFKQGLLHRYWLKIPEGHDLSDDAKLSLKEQLDERAGLSNAHRVLIMPGGTTLEKMSMSLADAQTLELSEFSMVMLAQFLGIPPHMLELVNRSTSWGTGIEQQTIGFNIYTMDPWLTSIEEALDRDFLDPQTHYSKFNRRALLAADMQARVAYYTGLGRLRALRINEIRDLEDMDDLPWGQDPPPAPNESLQSVNDDDAKERRGDRERAQAIAQESAGRLVRKEIARVSYLAQRTGSDGDAFARAVAEFYDEHADDVARTLRLDPKAARAYCQEQRDAVAAHGIGIMETWATNRASDLAHIAMEASP